MGYCPAVEWLARSMGEMAGIAQRRILDPDTDVFCNFAAFRPYRRFQPWECSGLPLSAGTASNGLTGARQHLLMRAHGMRIAVH